MRTTETGQRERQTRTVSRLKETASQCDRRQHELAQAIARFQEWDREMQAQHGNLYHRAMGWTLH